MKAVSAIGPNLYAEYIVKFLMSFPEIVKGRDLAYLDKVMGERAIRFYYRNRYFLFDTRHCDDHIRDGTFAFGLVREIYIRDCYFKFHNPDAFLSARTIVDLGANRGAFSVLMASTAEFVVSVEANPKFLPIIKHNMAINGFVNYEIYCGFVGEGGALAQKGYKCITMESLFHQYNLQNVDLIKIDIEGSEFGLFASHDWLERVKYVSMEVHPDYGDIRLLLDILSQHGFDYILADDNLCQTNDTRNASYVYANK